MKNKTDFSTLMKGSFFIFLGGIIANLFGYLIRIILSRELTLEEYGLFYAVFTFIFFFLFLRDLGLYSSFIKFTTEFKIKKEYGKIKGIILSLVSLQLMLSMIFVLLCWLFSDFLSIYYFKDENSKWILRILSLYFPLSIVIRFIPAYFTTFKKSNPLAIFEPTKNIITYGLIILFLSLGYTIYAAVYSYLIVNILLLLLFIIPISKTFKFSNYKIKEPIVSLKKVVIFGLPLIGTRFVTRFISYSDTILLTFLSTLTNVGIYNIILPTALLLLLIPNTLNKLYLPNIVEYNTKKNFKNINLLSSKIYRYLYIILLPIVITSIFFSGEFLKILFNQEYLAGDTTLKILLFSIIFYSFSSIAQSYFIGIEKPKRNFKMTSYAAMINVLLNIILIPMYGLIGAGIATLISSIYLFVYAVYKLYNDKIVEFKFKEISLVILSSIIFLTSIIISNQSIKADNFVKVILSVMISSLIYLSTIIVFKLIPIQEIIRK